MKKSIIICIVVVVFSFAFRALAEDHQNQETSGFSGMVNIGGLWMNSKSQLQPDSENKRLDQLSQEAQSTDKIFLLPIFKVNYNFTNGNQIYMGIPFEDKPNATLGVKHSMRNAGMIDLSAFYNLPKKVWRDPYLTGVDRTETDETSYGGRFKYQLNQWGISYKFERVDVDQDEIGLRLPDLKRDGNIHSIKASYGIKVGLGFMLEPGITYTLADIDGKSNQYNGYKGGLDVLKKWQDLMFQISVKGGVNDYDTIHPIFDQTREDNIYETMGSLSWFNPLGYKRFFLSVGGGYKKSDSNIDFYDSERYFTFTTIGYQFGGGEHHNDDDR